MLLECAGLMPAIRLAEKENSHAYRQEIMLQRSVGHNQGTPLVFIPNTTRNAQQPDRLQRIHMRITKIQLQRKQGRQNGPAAHPLSTLARCRPRQQLLPYLWFRLNTTNPFLHRMADKPVHGIFKFSTLNSQDAPLESDPNKHQVPSSTSNGRNAASI